MRVLVACESSGAVRDAFIAAGHEALSCDLLPTDSPGPHVVGDCFGLDWSAFDLVVAHPPCTQLAVSGNRHYAGTEGRRQAAEFVRRMWQQPVERLAIENPVGVINTLLSDMPRPQYVQPHQYGHDASKTTGLWLRGLPRLVGTRDVPPRWVCCGETLPPEVGKYGCPHCLGEGRPLPRWANQTNSGQNRLPPTADRWKLRSATYAGIAAAMADQWGRP